LNKTLCGKRHQADSLRTGIVENLKRAFRDAGRGQLDYEIPSLNNPARSRFVQEYYLLKERKAYLGYLQNQLLAFLRKN
jgi:hypothetical protein